MYFDYYFKQFYIVFNPSFIDFTRRWLTLPYTLYISNLYLYNYVYTKTMCDYHHMKVNKICNNKITQFLYILSCPITEKIEYFFNSIFQNPTKITEKFLKSRCHISEDRKWLLWGVLFCSISILFNCCLSWSQESHHKQEKTSKIAAS